MFFALISALHRACSLRVSAAISSGVEMLAVLDRDLE